MFRNFVLAMFPILPGISAQLQPLEAFEESEKISAVRNGNPRSSKPALLSF